MATHRLSLLTFLAVGVATCVLMVVFIAPWASSHPDGLEKVSADTGIDASALEHDLAGSPLADYGVDGVDSRMLGTGLAGVIGVVATFVVGAGSVWLIRRRRDPAARPTTAGTT